MHIQFLVSVAKWIRRRPPKAKIAGSSPVRDGMSRLAQFGRAHDS